MRPLLEVLDDGRDHHVKTIRADLACRSRSIKERPARAIYRIGDRGREVLVQNPDRVDLKVQERAWRPPG
jgi:hypothetical protein